MRDGEERESKSESDKRIDEETSTGDPTGAKERKRTSGRFGELNRGSERGRERERVREMRLKGGRDGRTRRVLTKLTGADLRRNLTNSGLNPPTRAVDLSCLPVNLAAVLAA